jgi:hypothetical protein
MSTLRTPRVSTTSLTESHPPAPTPPTPEGSVPAVIPSEGAPPPAISSEEIAARAYTLFLGRGGQPGGEWDDWFQAEAELLREKEQADGPADQ